MHAPNPAAELVTNEVWVAKGSHWVEAGITVGAKSGGGYVTSPFMFWAAMRSTTPAYSEHYKGAYTLNSYSNVDIVQNGVDGAMISIDGQSYASASDFVWPADELNAGTESNSDYIHTYGSQSELGWYDLSWSFHHGWSTSTATASTLETDPSKVYVNWVGSSHDWIRSGEGGAC
jgi:hypothetical protein